MRLLAARHKAVKTAVKLSLLGQNLCSELLDNECFSMLLRNTPLAAGRHISERMHNTRLGSGVQKHTACVGRNWEARWNIGGSHTRSRPNCGSSSVQCFE